jgi:hypothetical protein
VKVAPEPPIPAKDQICQCSHGLDKHVRFNAGGGTHHLVCTVQSCTCSNFTLNHIR